MTKISKVIALTALITALLLMSVTQAWAATMKFRLVVFTTNVESTEVGDVADHNLYLGESTGLASFETGEVAVATLKWTCDYTKGTGSCNGYFLLTFEDGSTIGYTVDQTTRPDPKGKGSLFEATLVITHGGGRYAGIQGKGTYTGRRPAVFGAGAANYFDHIITYTLP